MIEQPERVNAELQRLVDEGKAFTFHFSPDTSVRIVSTNAAEVQQVIEALEPVEEADIGTVIRTDGYMAWQTAFYENPAKTMHWIKTLTDEFTWLLTEDAGLQAKYAAESEPDVW